MPTLRNITACHKTGLSIKEKQAARACSFIFRQALIFLCLLPVMNCILISTHVTKKLIKKEEISRGEKETRKHSSINLKFLRKEKEGLRFKIRENITYTDYEVNQYKALYLCDKQVKKDNQGRMKFIVIGLAWVYEGTGKASYIKHLAIYSIFTLGIDMVISIGDWISLPFRLGSYEEEKVEKESFKSDQKQESRDIKDGEMVLVRDTSYYPVINSEVVIPESLLFYKRPIYYNSGKTNLVYKKDKSSKRKKYIRNNFAKIFERDTFYQLYIDFLKDKPEYKQKAINGFIRENDPKWMEEFLKTGVELNQYEKQFLPPLHMAISYARPDLVRLFIKYGADAIFKNNKGQDALTYTKFRYEKEKNQKRKDKLKEIIVILSP